MNDKGEVSAAAGAWQPIESAPKDGQEVLLFWSVGRYSHTRMEIGKWNDDRYSSKPRPYWGGSVPNNITGYRASPPTLWAPIFTPQLIKERSNG